MSAVARATGLRTDVLKRWERSSRTPQAARKERTVHPEPRVLEVVAVPTAPAPVAAATPVPLRMQIGAFVVTVSLAPGVA